jgi:thiol-disulfide isomerase/thioredoxin
MLSRRSLTCSRAQPARVLRGGLRQPQNGPTLRAHHVRCRAVLEVNGDNFEDEVLQVRLRCSCTCATGTQLAGPVDSVPQACSRHRAVCCVAADISMSVVILWWCSSRFSWLCLTSAGLQQADKPVLIEFWASWCGPCKLIDPLLKQLDSEDNGLKIAKIECDSNKDLVEKYGVRFRLHPDNYVDPPHMLLINCCCPVA